MQEVILRLNNATYNVTFVCKYTQNKKTEWSFMSLLLLHIEDTPSTCTEKNFIFLDHYKLRNSDGIKVIMRTPLSEDITILKMFRRQMCTVELKSCTLCDVIL